MAQSSANVKVSGANGPLAKEKARAVIEKIKRANPDSTMLERHLAIEEAIVGQPLIVGNRVTLLEDGKATFAAVFEAIKRAKKHVNVESYIIEDDEIGQQFADLLIAKQGQGVQINLIYDSVGSIGTPKEFFRRLQDAGINVVEFNPVNPLASKGEWRLNHRDHRKLIVVDGELAFLGGINISSVYSGSSFRKKQADNKEAAAPWRDTHMQIEGPVVADFQRLFMATWEKQKGPAIVGEDYFPPLKPVGKEVVRAIGSSPDDAYTLMYATMISVIQNAEASISLTNAYFVPDPQLLESLKEAARRGVDVRLILPKITDSSLTLYVGRSFYEELLTAGVRIYERRNRMLHAKTAVVDGVWSTIGSTNLDWRSFVHNDEINAVVLGADFAGRMAALFQRDLSASDEITLEEWQNRSFIMRLREAYARLWQRLL